MFCCHDGQLLFGVHGVVGGFSAEFATAASFVSKLELETASLLDEKRQRLEQIAERIVQWHRERDGQEDRRLDSSSEPVKARRQL